MAKLTAWFATIIAILLILPLIKVDIGTTLNSWLIAIGIGKLIRNYKK